MSIYLFFIGLFLVVLVVCILVASMRDDSQTLSEDESAIIRRMLDRSQG